MPGGEVFNEIARVDIRGKTVAFVRDLGKNLQIIEISFTARGADTYRVDLLSRQRCMTKL